MHPQSSNDLGKIIEADFPVGIPRPKTTSAISEKGLPHLGQQNLFVCRRGNEAILLT
jgi:hypothetical protein